MLLSTTLLLVIACTDSESVDSTASSDTTETESPATTTASPTTSEPATSTTDVTHDKELTERAWASVVTLFSAINSGDDDAVFGLFAPNVVISDNIGGVWQLDEWEILQAWDTAQGLVMTPPDCKVVHEVPGESVTLTCSTGSHNALSQAVGRVPIPTNLRISVTADGISQLNYQYSQPNFRDLYVPMMAWMSANHPDVIWEYFWGTSVEEARTNGVLNAEYSAEWATYLEENGCAYDEGC